MTVSDGIRKVGEGNVTVRKVDNGTKGSKTGRKVKMLRLER